MLKATFLDLLKPFSDQESTVYSLWEEIENSYTHRQRYYHNLKHLETMLELLIPLKSLIHDWESVLFALYYHDIIYNPLKRNNEKRSAELAVKRLLSFAIPSKIIGDCKDHIMATQHHLLSLNNDTNIFIDADMAILGQSWEKYIGYSQSVRKEYAVYPDLIYNAGRKAVLKSFLDKGKIFKTELFQSRFEEQARANILKELDLLA